MFTRLEQERRKGREGEMESTPRGGLYPMFEIVKNTKVITLL